MYGLSPRLGWLCSGDPVAGDAGRQGEDRDGPGMNTDDWGDLAQYRQLSAIGTGRVAAVELAVRPGRGPGPGLSLSLLCN